MTKTSYSKLIRVLADDRQTDRRKTDAPGVPNGVERRQEDRREVDKPVDHSHVHKNIPHPVKSFNPSIFKEMTFHKIVSGSYYAKVLNKHTGQYVEFGKFVISGYTAIERKIKHYNEVHHTSYPLLSENTIYHLENGHLKPADLLSSQYVDFVRLFNKAKSCSAEEAKHFSLDNPVDHAEAVFVENKSSNIFAYSSYKNVIIRTAKAKINK